MSETLKPCPFCGGPGELYFNGEDYMAGCSVAVQDAYADKIVGFCEMEPVIACKTEEHAIRAWNTRAPIHQNTKGGE